MRIKTCGRDRRGWGNPPPGSPQPRQLMLVVASLPFLLYRTITEDRVLLADLPGYRDYAARVRWRLAAASQEPSATPLASMIRMPAA